MAKFRDCLRTLSACILAADGKLTSERDKKRIQCIQEYPAKLRFLGARAAADLQYRVDSHDEYEKMLTKVVKDSADKLHLPCSDIRKFEERWLGGEFRHDDPSQAKQETPIHSHLFDNYLPG